MDLTAWWIDPTVSILVLVDVALEHQIAGRAAPHQFVVSILVLVDVALEPYPAIAACAPIWVSILVLVDVALEP